MPSSRSREEAALSVLAAIIRGESWSRSSLWNPSLRKNFRRLNRAFCRNDSMAEVLRESSLRLLPIVLARSELLSTPHRLARHLASALVRVISYSDRWIRSPEDWVPAGPDHWSDLLRHLFVKWELPVFFESAWLAKGDLRHFERDWYCALATGANWRTLEKAPASLTNRAAYLAMQSPDDSTICEALRRGQLEAMGASPALKDAVLKSCFVRNLSNDEIWSRLLPKIIANPVFNPAEFGLIADVFQMHYRSFRFNRARDLVRLPFHELCNHCRQHWRRLLEGALSDGLTFRTHDLRSAGLRRELRHFSMAVWEPMPDVEDCQLTRRSRNGTVTHWEIRQLVRHSQLMSEGQIMKHCVGGYRRDCQTGRAAIFSLGRWNQDERFEPRVTVEICRYSRWLLQAQAKWNEPPEFEELEILREWAKRNEVKMR